MQTNVANLHRAIQIAEQIEKLQTELNQILSGVGGKVSTTPAAATKAAKKNKRSPEVRKRMAAAQKARWAKVNDAKTPAAAAKPVKKKGGMSAAGRAAIVAAQKARWAKVKAAKGAPAKAPAPKAEAKPVKKRKISAASRAKMVAGAKARWAAKKVASDIATAIAITPMV